jgi:hypothetical protein
MSLLFHSCEGRALCSSRKHPPRRVLRVPLDKYTREPFATQDFAKQDCSDDCVQIKSADGLALPEISGLKPQALFTIEFVLGIEQSSLTQPPPTFIDSPPKPAARLAASR